jgi:serine/threonine-protein kinase
MKKFFTTLLATLFIVLATSCGGGGSSAPTTYTVTNLAGSINAGSADGTGSAASFARPSGLSVDISGNVYVADKANNKIRKVTPAGVVTTLAGTGTAGSANGAAAAASFSEPIGVTVDTSGNVYVSDFGNQLIRKITPAGLVTTLAGSNTSGSVDGTGSAASFNFPYALAVDTSSNVYVADTFNHKIRKIIPSGVVTTLAGSGTAGSADGTGAAASFNYPVAVTVDTSGNVYVAQTGNNDVIRKITPAGVVTTLAGSSYGSADGTGTLASFAGPSGLAVDTTGNVYVADRVNNKIRKVTPAGVVTTLAGTGTAGSTNGTGSAASFNDPFGIAVDSNGNLYVGDSGNNQIRKLTPLY